ncbi:copper resistance CopC family protein [Kiloniella litopenaei]|uniref:copper resistance CopC family protein n=1 Tax=Kiloniella litopenaei TaxID=1549748 RepID=UPI000695DE4C|nr:copper resistance CopC family protein [Kiloniella litopenaei]
MLNISSSRPVKLLVVLLFIVFIPSLSFAHTKVAQTIPANGATLATSPDEIKLIFSDTLKITAMKLLDYQGKELILKHDKAPKALKEKVAIPQTLAAGTYRVIWRGISADGHPIKGQITFTIAP